jgi:hypothetical protein
VLRLWKETSRGAVWCPKRFRTRLGVSLGGVCRTKESTGLVCFFMVVVCWMRKVDGGGVGGGTGRGIRDCLALFLRANEVRAGAGNWEKWLWGGRRGGWRRAAPGEDAGRRPANPAQAGQYRAVGDIGQLRAPGQWERGGDGKRRRTHS